jgi:hypothetical protein
MHWLRLPLPVVMGVDQNPGGCMMCGSLGRKVRARWVCEQAGLAMVFFDSVRRILVRTPADGKQIHLAERLF